ncbi:MAG: CBS domain-containing protein [Rhodospirillales bacterium]
MKVSSVLEAKGSDVRTVHPKESIQTVIDIFKDDGIGALVVSDNYVEIQGIIAERDVILGLAIHGPDLLAMSVVDIMRKSVVCAPDDELELVMSRMTINRVRHVAVADDGLLCGIVSIGDVVKKQLSDLEMEKNVLRDAYMVRAALV